jgi:hypothetical protein
MKKGLLELAGEFFLEASVLVLVFGFLEGYWRNELTPVKDVFFFGLSLALFWGGYILGRIDKDWNKTVIYLISFAIYLAFFAGTVVAVWQLEKRYDKKHSVTPAEHSDGKTPASAHP